MAFNLFEQPSGTKKRILKSQSKSLKFTSSSFAPDTKSKNQGSDYYVGVFDPAKNKCYLLQASTAYQMQQKIDGFQEKFAPQQSNRDKTYYEMKQDLAKSFGTAKAQRKL